MKKSQMNKSDKQSKLLVCVDGVHNGLVFKFVDPIINSSSPNMGKFACYFPVVKNGKLLLTRITNSKYISGSRELYHASLDHMVPYVSDNQVVANRTNIDKSIIDDYVCGRIIASNIKLVIKDGDLVVYDEPEPVQIVDKTISIPKSQLGILYQFCIDNDIKMD